MNTFKTVCITLFLVTLSVSCVHAFDVTPPPIAMPRELEFGDLQWRIKSSSTPIGPGPNYWSASEDLVWVDDEGLHLSILNIGGRWYCSEIFTRRRVGYGTYTFTVDTDIARYHPHVVAGFFTWDSSPEEYNREIDIEFAAWGNPNGTLMQYVVQPYYIDGNMHIFDPKLTGSVTTHRIVWTSESVVFSSYHGDVDPDQISAQKQLIETWKYTKGAPSEGRVRFRINLWLFEGVSLQQPVRLTIKKFSFTPL